MAGPFVSFLTDFGLDTAPATCRGVVWSICPEARINDLSHTVPRHDVRAGAFLLWSSVPYLPVGVHLAVVDPGVGTERRGVAVQAARGDRFVGPDNGLLVPAAERLGGIVAAHALENPSLWRPDVSHTFHGRDVFAPVAAHLAAGEPIESAGPPVAREDLVDLAFGEPIRDGDALVTSVLFVDAFGNCRLAGQPDDLAALRGSLAGGDRFRVIVGDAVHNAPWRVTFGEAAEGDLLLYEDADYAGLGIAVNQASAADRLGLTAGTPVRIEPA